MYVRTHMLICAAGLVAGGCALSPTPLDSLQVAETAESNLVRVSAEQEPIVGAIGLYEAMARALKYNLDHRIEVFQRSLREQELNLTHYDMLPRAVANSGFARRDSFSASTSSRVENDRLAGTGAFQTFNTSSDRHLRDADIEFSWHVLDFGLSYVRAHQAADKVLIAEEARRKVINRIVEDVRTAFWRAVTAERLVSRLQRLENRTRSALANTRRMSDDGRTSPVTALTYERELVEIKRTIQELQRELSVAKTQLASLMNVKPGTKFSLRYRSHDGALPSINAKSADMVWTALNNRPELREVAYQRRINMHEASAALLELLPGIQLYLGDNYTSNSFLLHNDWLSWGAKASWNLMRLVRYPQHKHVIEAQDQLLDQRALALTMAVMTQVHVSRVRYYHLRREFQTAREYVDVQSRLVAKLRAEFAAGKISEQTLIREEMNTLVAEVRRDIAFAGVQNGYANIYASMGLDPFPEDFNTEADVATVAKRLKGVWTERGRVTTAPQIMTVAARG